MHTDKHVHTVAQKDIYSPGSLSLTLTNTHKFTPLLVRWDSRYLLLHLPCWGHNRFCYDCILEREHLKYLWLVAHCYNLMCGSHQLGRDCDGVHSFWTIRWFHFRDLYHGCHHLEQAIFSLRYARRKEHYTSYGSQEMPNNLSTLPGN